MNNQDIIDYVMDTPHNTNPTILKQKLNEQDFENRSDWNQNDSTKADYVKNRTHYTELVDKVYEVTIVDTTAITPISDEVAQAFNSSYENITFTLNDGTVLWLKKDYKLNVNSMDGYSWIAGSLNTIRFGFGITNGSHYLFASKPGVFKGIAQEEVVHKIPEKYLPDGIGGGSGGLVIHLSSGQENPAIDRSYEEIKNALTSGANVILLGEDGAIHLLDWFSPADEGISFARITVQEQAIDKDIYTVFADGHVENTYTEFYPFA